MKANHSSFSHKLLDSVYDCLSIMSLRKVSVVHKLYCLLSTLSSVHCIIPEAQTCIDDLSVEYVNEMNSKLRRKKMK